MADNVCENSISDFLYKLFNSTLLAKHDESGTIIMDIVLKFDLRGELGVGIELGQQAIGVVANECIVKSFYFIRRLVMEILEKDINSLVGLKQIAWGKVKLLDNPTISRMLTIATGVFTVLSNIT